MIKKTLACDMCDEHSDVLFPAFISEDVPITDCGKVLRGNVHVCGTHLVKLAGVGTVLSKRYKMKEYDGDMM